MHGLRKYQNPGGAVVDDVGQFIRRQIRIDAGVIQAGSLAGAAAFDVARVVLHEDRIMIETFQAAISQKMREPVGACFKFRIGNGFPGLRHDKGGLVGSRLRISAWVHWPLLPCDGAEFDFGQPCNAASSSSGCSTIII
jgi:hypothetical protein